MKRLWLAVVLAASLSACSAPPDRPIAATKNGEFSEQDVTLRSGRVIHCLFWTTGVGNTVTRAMSCDWTVAK